MVNSNALKNIIEKKGMKYLYLAKKLNLSAYGLSKKINNETEFKASEIVKLCEILKIDVIERDGIFFANQVD